MVKLSALDGAERLRMPARVPQPDGAFRFTGGPTRWIASPVWVVDHLLRGAGIHTSPPPRPGCLLYASLHGGVAANIGYLESVNGSWGEWYKQGASFECAAEGGYSAPYQATYVPATLPNFAGGGGTWFEFWAVNQRPNGKDCAVEIHTTWSLVQDVAHYLTFSVNFTKGTLTAYSGSKDDPAPNASIGWTWNPLKVEGRRLHVAWWVRERSSGEVAVTPVVTGEDGVPAFLTEGYLPALPLRFASALDRIRFGLTGLRAEAVQVSSLPTRPNTAAEVTQQGTWKRGASLSVPRFPMRVIPPVRGSAWDVITEIAKATLATAEFSSDGYFKWRDHTRWAYPSGGADLDVTSSREISSLTVTEEIDACRNHCSVRVSDWIWVYQAKSEILADVVDPIPIPAGATIVRTLAIQETRMDPRTPKCRDGVDAVTIRNDANPMSPTVPASVVVTMRRDPGLITLTMRSLASVSTLYYHGAQLTTLTPDGNPGQYLWSSWDDDSRRIYGTQQYEHDVRGWVQTIDAATELAVALRNAGSFPAPLLQSVEVLPDPRIELGDIVRVRDTTGAQLDTLAWVIGIKTSGADGRVTQTLTLRGITPNGTPQDAGLTPDPPIDPDAPPPPP
ncbi:hypothetical protein [Streptomyces sp. NPDC059819]|uniref:hypothetical protein n=1 Tax=Streptomyces sp. NPDC059819 TaxID=3346963 RepID=UPI00364B9D27